MTVRLEFGARDRRTDAVSGPRMWGVELVVVGAMIAANSIFAAYEIALASIALTIIPPTAYVFAKN